MYYSQIEVKPSLGAKYSLENTAKKVVYRGVTSSQYNNIPANSTFNQLINAGVSHPTGVLIVPSIAPQTTQDFGDSQWKSPFDSCPETTCPVPLTNLQVSVGGQNILESTLFSPYENFISQVNLAEQLSSSDFGVATGILNQSYWEWSRYYYVNVERSNDADKLVARNINRSFLNTSLLPIDCMVFVFYSDELTINVNTGIIDK